MEIIKDLNAAEGIDKLTKLIKDIKVCLFETTTKENGDQYRPMQAQEVDEEGAIWFFSPLSSFKNTEISENPFVKLYFSHPGKSSFLIVEGNCEIITDRSKIEELWTPLNKAWFKDGENDQNISLIKVNTQSADYWDVEGDSMINFIKVAASALTGDNFIKGREGHITV